MAARSAGAEENGAHRFARQRFRAIKRHFRGQPQEEGLSDSGLREGRDYVLDLRWAEGNYERFPAFARELVERKADVILATTISAVRAAQRATSAIPIVMTWITNAVGTGLVASLARPGGNTTGISNLNEDLTPKLWTTFARSCRGARDRYPRQSRPVDQRVGRDHAWPYGGFRSDGQPVRSQGGGELDAAFDGIAKSNSDALLIVPDTSLSICASQSRRWPSSIASRRCRPSRSITDAGGLLGYGAAAARPLSSLRLFRESDSGRRQSGRYAGRATHTSSTLINARTAECSVSKSQPRCSPAPTR